MRITDPQQVDNRALRNKYTYIYIRTRRFQTKPTQAIYKIRMSQMRVVTFYSFVFPILSITLDRQRRKFWKLVAFCNSLLWNENIARQLDREYNEFIVR